MNKLLTHICNPLIIISCYSFLIIDEKIHSQFHIEFIVKVYALKVYLKLERISVQIFE